MSSRGVIVGVDPDMTSNMVDLDPQDGAEGGAKKAMPKGNITSGQSTQGLQSMALMGPTSQEDALFMQQTIWDAVILIGLRKDGEYLLTWFQTIVVLFVFATNVVVQASLVLSIGDNLSESGLHDNVKTAVIDQRLYDYQHWDRIDSTEIETHNSRMCRDLVYTSQSELYSHVESYLKTEPVLGLPWGLIVSGSAMLLFSLSMMTEFYRVLHEATHIWFLNHGQREDNSVKGYPGRNVNVIVSMSLICKASSAVLVLLPRLCIAATLTWYGLEFIGQTLSVEDLILNACALEVVKAVDEFLFRGLVSAKLRNLVLRTRFETFKVPKNENDTRFRWKGVSYKDVIATVARFSFLGLWLGVSYTVVLAPFHSTVKDFEVAMCGHDTAAAWEQHPLVGMPFFATVSLSTEVNSPLESSLAEQFACFSAAGAEMIRIRAGFDPQVSSPNESLKEKIRGTSQACQAGSSGGFGSCADLDLADLNTLEATTAESYFGDAACGDLEVHIAMVVDTCSEVQYSKFLPWFEGRKECSDFKELCECDQHGSEGFCTYTNTTRLQDEYHVSSTWVEILQYLCPRTCRMCQENRRLSVPEGEEGISAEPQPKPRSATPKPLKLPFGRTRMDVARRKAPTSRSRNWANEVDVRLAVLEQRNVELEQRNTVLEQRNAVLEQRSGRLESLERRLAAMEASWPPTQAAPASGEKPHDDVAQAI